MFLLVRVAIVAESFLPSVNGVTNSVCQLADYLHRNGHEAIIIAPGPGDDSYNSTPVIRVAACSMPFYDDVRVGFSGTTVYRTLRSFKPDVVHLAAPLVLGGTAGRSARRMGIPVVAIFQTDIAGFARRYHLGKFAKPIWGAIRTAHSSADLTLAPSTITSWQLRENGLQDVAIWPRGVDADRFHPSKRDMQLHHEWAPQGQTIVGYVGRLAREKEVERLQVLSGRPGIKLVIVGDGPLRSSLEKSMPDATFTGVLRGEELARAFATLDVFVHTGLNETFCQAIQEALASGVPVVGHAAGGPLDIIQHRQNGLLWSPEHPESLAGAVQQLSEDVLLRRLLASHGRNSVVGRTWSSVMNDLVDHYQAVIGTTPLLRRTA